MTDRPPASPHGSSVARAAQLLALAVSVVLATGTVAAGASPIDRAGPAPDRQSGATVSIVTPSADQGAGPAVDAARGPVVQPAAAGAGSAPAPVVAAGVRAPRLVYRGSAARRVIALTFDDGWSAANGHRILDILASQRVPATFFVNSVYLAADPDLWRTIADDGFVVGNHTYLHDDITTLTSAALVRDLQRNARVWLAVTGHVMAPLFRPPYGRRNVRTDRAAARAGYPTIILWDYPSNDTYRLSDATLLHNATAGRAGSIVLMHVGPDATPRILGRVIASYRERGFTFVTIPQLLAGLPAPAPSPPRAPEPTIADSPTIARPSEPPARELR